ncbi:MAG: zinc ribbon domain-containing protein [Thermoplasmatota archaeon]
MAMKCANCGFENIDGAKFCQKCGLRIAMSARAEGITGADRRMDHSARATLTRCPKCGTERTGAGDGIHCTECDFMFSFPYPDASSSPTSVHYLPFSRESPSSPRTSQKEPPQEEPNLERHYVVTQRPVSTAGGAILILALLVLVVSWGLTESLLHQVETGTYSGNLQDAYDSERFYVRMWNFGVILAVLGGIVIAFSGVHRYQLRE